MLHIEEIIKQIKEADDISKAYIVLEEFAQQLATVSHTDKNLSGLGACLCMVGIALDSGKITELLVCMAAWLKAADLDYKDANAMQEIDRMFTMLGM